MLATTKSRCAARRRSQQCACAAVITVSYTPLNLWCFHEVPCILGGPILGRHCAFGVARGHPKTRQLASFPFTVYSCLSEAADRIYRMWRLLWGLKILTAYSIAGLSTLNTTPA